MGKMGPFRFSFVGLFGMLFLLVVAVAIFAVLQSAFPGANFQGIETTFLAFFFFMFLVIVVFMMFMGPRKY